MAFVITDIDGATQAPGSAAPSRGVQMLGVDGATSRVLLLDASGRPIVVGAGTAGVPAGGVLTVQGVNVTATGALNALNATVAVALAGRHGAAVQFVAGSLVGTVLAEFSLDGGTNWQQTVFKDGSGRTFRPFTFGGFTLAYSIPVPEGTTHVRVRVSSFTSGTTPANMVATTAINSIPQERATFTAYARATAIALNKSMISIVNAVSTPVVVRIHEIWLVNVQTGAVTGVIGEFTLRRCASHSAGTDITPQSMDTGDVLSASVTTKTNGTIGGEGSTALWENKWSTDEWGTGTLDQEGHDHALQATNPFWRVAPGGKPITLYGGQGLTLRQLTNSTAGTFDVRIVFTQE